MSARSLETSAAPSAAPSLDQLIRTLRPFKRIVLVSHINPDPDALASMLGLEALFNKCLPDTPVTLSIDGMIARAENQAMVELLEIPLVPVASIPFDSETAIVMVDTQPQTGQRANESTPPTVVLDHHETPGRLESVLFHDIRPELGATTTLVTGYLRERRIEVSRRMATALLYGIESEQAGYPRESSAADDECLVWLFPKADKDLLARIRNPRLPQSYFETFDRALGSAQLYRDVIISCCGKVPQPDIVAELADFFVRFECVSWSIVVGRYEDTLKLSIRADHIGAHCGELLRDAVNGLGAAGGHDRRAGGTIPVAGQSDEQVRAILDIFRGKVLARIGIADHQGRPLLEHRSRTGGS